MVVFGNRLTAPPQITQVKRSSALIPLFGKNIADKGKTSGLKKISTRRYALGSIFFAALAANATAPDVPFQLTPLSLR
jgi:hypothetical protein